MLNCARETTLAAVDGFGIADLDFLDTGSGNSIGALLAHIATAMNAHWAWFHVVEEEINHRGQMRLLRARRRALASGSTEH